MPTDLGSRELTDAELHRLASLSADADARDLARRLLALREEIRAVQRDADSDVRLPVARWRLRELVRGWR